MGNNWLNLASFIICGLLLGGILTYAAIPREVTVIKTVPVEKVVVSSVINETELLNKLNKIDATVNADDNWESEAYNLATAEWEAKDNKDIFNAIEDIYGDIEVRGDISSVTVKDTDTLSLDTKDKDAVVSQEVRVRYETTDGDNIKVYLVIETTIEDGEVTDQTIDEA